MQWLANLTSWDFFIGVYTELHTANHMLWHLRHPLPGLSTQTGNQNHDHYLLLLDNQLALFKANLRASCKIAVMTIDDTTSNSMDIASMVLLPELLYRWSNMGDSLLSKYEGDDKTLHWKNKIWKSTTKAGKQRLESPEELASLNEPLAWHPAYWYRRLWPEMKAFALPSVGDGYIRLNVIGRESKGLLSPDCFTETLEELQNLISTCKNAYGVPIAQEVLLTRRKPAERPEVDPDIIVVWNAESITQELLCEYTVQMPLGPFPFFRSGGHYGHGSTITNRIYVEKDLRHELFGGTKEQFLQLNTLPLILKRYFCPLHESNQGCAP
jgi:predicted AlkP superfamily phosphohydrolase/phosphomutase